MDPTDKETETKYCSNCKRDINAVTFELHESHCRRHITLCAECDEPVPNIEREAHFLEYHAPLPCELCGELVAKDKLDEHKEQSCRERMLECKYCDLDVKQVDYEEHVDSCGSRTDHCELCLQRIMLKNMEEHRTLKCGSLRAESPLDPQTLQELAELDDHNAHPPYTDGGGAFQPDFFAHGFHPYAVDSDDTEVVVLGDGPGSASSTHPPPPAYVNQGNVQVDPQWIETVVNACGEEELDNLLAQNIFAENMRHATARDEYHGIEDDVIQEGLQADRQREHSQRQNSTDEEVARRLQNEFDNKALEEQRDQELARQLQQENNPPPPSRSSEANTQPSYPQPPGPPTVFEDTPPAVPADNDAVLAQRLQENEMSFNQQIYTSSGDQSGFSGQLGYGNSHQGFDKLSNDEALARKLQESELASSYHQGGRENQPELPGAIPQQAVDNNSVISDGNYAGQLQRNNLQARYPHVSVPPQPVPEYNAYYPQQISGHQPVVELGTHHQEREATHQNLSDITHQSSIDSDAELARRLQVQEEEAYSHLHSNDVPSGIQSHSMVAQPESDSYRSSGTGTGYRNGTGATVSYHDDEDQPRSKHQPGHAHQTGSHTHPYASDPSDEAVVNIPCQYCGKLFPKETIMYHQQYHCTGDYPSTSPPHTGHHLHPSHHLHTTHHPHTGQHIQCLNCGLKVNVVSINQPIERGETKPSLSLNVLDSDSDEEQPPRGGMMSACRFCKQLHTAVLLRSHEALCNLNPDKHLKDVYGVDGFAQKSGSRSGERDHTSSTMNLTPSDAELPCQFCDKGFPTAALGEHQAMCYLNPLHQAQVSHDPHVTSLATPRSVEKAPCEKCGEMISLDSLIKHETMCMYTPSLPVAVVKPRPSTPPTTSSAVTSKKRPMAIRFPQQEVATSSARTDPQNNPTQPATARTVQDSSSTLVTSHSSAFTKFQASEYSRASRTSTSSTISAKVSDPETPLSQRPTSYPRPTYPTEPSPGIYQASSKPHTVPPSLTGRRPALNASPESSDFTTPIEPKLPKITTPFSVLPPETPTDLRQDISHQPTSPPATNGVSHSGSFITSHTGGNLWRGVGEKDSLLYSKSYDKDKSLGKKGGAKGVLSSLTITPNPQSSPGSNRSLVEVSAQQPHSNPQQGTISTANLSRHQPLSFSESSDDSSSNYTSQPTETDSSQETHMCTLDSSSIDYTSQPTETDSSQETHIRTLDSSSIDYTSQPTETDSSQETHMCTLDSSSIDYTSQPTETDSSQETHMCTLDSIERDTLLQQSSDSPVSGKKNSDVRVREGFRIKQDKLTPKAASYSPSTKSTQRKDYHHGSPSQPKGSSSSQAKSVTITSQKKALNTAAKQPRSSRKEVTSTPAQWKARQPHNSPKPVASDRSSRSQQYRQQQEKQSGQQTGSKPKPPSSSMHGSDKKSPPGMSGSTRGSDKKSPPGMSGSTRGSDKKSPSGMSGSTDFKRTSANTGQGRRGQASSATGQASTTRPRQASRKSTTATSK